MSKAEDQLLKKEVRLMRGLYLVCMGLGFPLWMLMLCLLLILAGMSWSGQSDDWAVIEYPESTSVQITTLRVSGAGYFLAYLAAFFMAWRVTRFPWIVFLVMLLPVGGLCYAATFFPIMDSKTEQISWLAYLGSLAAILMLGMAVAVLVERKSSVTLDPVRTL